MEALVTPSGVVIDASACSCGEPATQTVSSYVIVGPIMLPVCDGCAARLAEDSAR